MRPRDMALIECIHKSEVSFRILLAKRLESLYHVITLQIISSRSSLIAHQMDLGIWKFSLHMHTGLENIALV